MSSRAAHSRVRALSTTALPQIHARNMAASERGVDVSDPGDALHVGPPRRSTGSRASARPWRERASAAATLTCERITVVPDPRRGIAIDSGIETPARTIR